jgi:acyl-coenzyme A synthetase/AMP-(fatty) acid ligase
MSETYPNKVAYILHKNNGLKLTFSDVRDRAYRLAHNLLRIGLKKGDRIGFLVPNTYQLLVSYIACGLIGIIVVPLDQDYGAAELEYMITKTQPAAMVVWNSNEFKETAAELFPNIDSFEDTVCGRKYQHNVFVNLKHLIFIDPSGANDSGISSRNVWTWTQVADEIIKSDSQETPEFPQVNSEDPFVIMFTSGTTGKPKGIVLNQFKLINMMRVARGSSKDWNFDLISCTTFLLNHYVAMASVLMTLYKMNSVLVIPSFKFDIVDILEAVEKYQCTGLTGLPKILHSIVNHPDRGKYNLSSLTTVMGAGQLTTAELINQFKHEFGLRTFIVGYGTTELNNFITHSIDLKEFNASEYKRCIGKVSSFIECKILNKDSGRIVNHNEEGEIVCFSNI